MLFDRAIAQAKELDAYFQQTGKTKGPFHGLPISIKDNFNLVGYDSTIGFASLVDDPATYNSTLVDLLLNAGAVLYCKTNVPTAMMIAESVNNVFGRTVNPRNRKLTSGGSSGGESALIAFGASRIGVGTDIGESTSTPNSPKVCTNNEQAGLSASQLPAQGSSQSDPPSAASPTSKPGPVSPAKRQSTASTDPWPKPSTRSSSGLARSSVNSPGCAIRNASPSPGAQSRSRSR